ncbi:MAG: dehydratase [Spirochaetes bacterium]|nr:dehydratase [Spirochaetota bacterium]
MEKLDYNNIEAGFELPSLTKEPITQVQLIRYAGASGDFNPIHTVPEFAKQAGLDGCIAHGMLIMGILGQMITNFADIKAVKKYGVSFKSMTKPGDVLTAKGIVKKKYENDEGRFIDCKVYIEDEKNDVKVDGKVTIQLD